MGRTDASAARSSLFLLVLRLAHVRPLAPNRPHRQAIPSMHEKPVIRPRRLRRTPELREMLQSVSVEPRHIVVPVFVCEGSGVARPVGSMPGVEQLSVDRALQFLSDLAQKGFRSFIVFGIVPREQKDDIGSAALDENNVVCRLLREVKQAKLPMLAMTDLCFCEYTSHGHCGEMTEDGSTVRNDITVERLVKQAVSHARAGADVVAPSGMMDNMISALRRGLDAAGFEDVVLLSYAVKYASAYYGPFRDAADSAPAFGDRRTYQMDAARDAREAMLEARLDVEQGADMVMVKPAGAYLDIIAAVRREVNVPVVAYQVSGEYAMIQAAGEKGWIDQERVMLESLQAIRRAGADLIISYFGPALARTRSRRD
jgi:porphobilinogen synthase